MAAAGALIGSADPGPARNRQGKGPRIPMLAFWRQPRFDPDTLSSIWVMACRDESPVVTAFSVAFRLGRGIAPADVMELVKGRRELFRLGLTPVQSRSWKERYRQMEAGEGAEAKPRRPASPKPAPKTGNPGADKAKGGDAKDDGAKGDEAEGDETPQPHALPDWLRVFDDEGPEPDQARVREWLGDKRITTSAQALERFRDKGFVIDENVIRSVFRLEPGLDAEPSDLATVNWGLEHIERLRRGRAETRQSVVALTTGIGGVAIGACVALTAPMVTTIYQGRPADNSRVSIDHQALVSGYGTVAASAAGARRAARDGDAEALSPALADIDKATFSMLPFLRDPLLRDDVRARRQRVAEACAPSGAPAASAPPDCPAALDELNQVLEGPIADLLAR
jgi:hypothetical protein